jgi:hypothetical protein
MQDRLINFNIFFLSDQADLFLNEILVPLIDIFVSEEINLNGVVGKSAVLNVLLLFIPSCHFLEVRESFIVIGNSYHYENTGPHGNVLIPLQFTRCEFAAN